jgi:hypothetical protein
MRAPHQFLHLVIGNAPALLQVPHDLGEPLRLLPSDLLKRHSRIHLKISTEQKGSISVTKTRKDAPTCAGGTPRGHFLCLQ